MRSIPLNLILCFLLLVTVTGCQAARSPSPNAVGGVTAEIPTPVASRTAPEITETPHPIAHSALEDIRSRGEVRVGVLYSYRPFGYLSENGDLKGFDVDLIKAIADDWGVKTTFVQVTRQTRLDYLERGEVDFIAAAIPHRRDLEADVDFTDTIFRGGYVALVADSSSATKPTDLNGQQIAIIGTEAQKVFADYSAATGISYGLVPVDSVDDAVLQFSQGAVSAIVGRREQVMLASVTLQNTRVLASDVLYEPYALAVRKGDAPLRDLLNLSLQKLAKSGTLGPLFSGNLYGYPTDIYAVLPGEPSYTYATFPTALQVAPSLTETMQTGQAIRVAGLNLQVQPSPFDSSPIIDGYNRAVINEVARRLNAPVQEIPQSTGATGLSLLKGGQADVVMGVRPDLALIGQAAFSLPYYQVGLRMARSQSVTIAGIDDLQFKPVAVISPIDISQDLVAKNSEYAKIQAPATPEDAYKALISSTVYAVVGDEFAIFLMGQADTSIVVGATRYRPTNYVILLPEADTEFKKLVDRTLQDMKTDGTLDKLVQQYLGPYVPSDNPLESPDMEIWP